MKKSMRILLIMCIISVFMLCSCFNKDNFKYKLLSNNTYEVIKVKDNGDDSVVIPDKYKKKNVTSIAEGALSESSKIVSLTIPKTIEYIGYNLCNYLVEIYNLSSLNIKMGETNNGHIGYHAKVIHKSAGVDSTIIEMDDFVFANVDDNYYLVKYNKNSKSIILPSNINEKKYIINDYAFYESNKLKDITIPQIVTEIGDYAFGSCKKLQSVIFEGDSKLNKIGDYAFLNCVKLENITIPNQVTNIGEEAFKCCSNLKKIEIPQNVKTIEKSAFSKTSIESIRLPKSLNKLGSKAFYKCEKLKSVEFQQDCKLEKIEYRTFDGCKNLQYLSFGSGMNIKKIEGAAFFECESLTTISIPTSVETIEAFAFSECLNLREIKIPKSLKSIRDYAFNLCENLEKVEYNGTVFEWYEIEIDGYDHYYLNSKLIIS